MTKYYKASYIVSKMARKFSMKSFYIWEVLSDEFNIIRGLGCVMTSEEVKELGFILACKAAE